MAWSRASDGIAWESRNDRDQRDDRDDEEARAGGRAAEEPVAEPSGGPGRRSPARAGRSSAGAPVRGRWSIVLGGAGQRWTMSAGQLDPVRRGRRWRWSTLVWHLGRQRRVADGPRGPSGCSGEEKCFRKALSSATLAGVLALGADDLVGHQDDRVGAGLLGGVVELEAEVVALADLLGGGDGLADRLAGQLDRAGAVVDLGDAQVVVLGVGPLDVGDATLGALDRAGDTGGLLLALTLAGPLLAGLGGPGARARRRSGTW